MSFSDHLLKVDTDVSHTLTLATVPITTASLMGWLPPLAALLSIVWLSIQIATSIAAWIDKRHMARGPAGPKGDKGDKGDPGHPPAPQ